MTLGSSEKPLDGFVVIDREGRLLEVSDSFCTLVGYDRRAVLGMRVSDFEDIEKPAETAQHVARISAGGSDRFQTRLRRSDGTRIAVEVSASSAGQGDGRQFVFIRDAGQWDLFLSEKKALEEHLRQAQKLECVGNLAGGIAHDLNNLLTVIDFHCEMLLAELDGNGPVPSSAAEIRKAGERASELIQRLLAFGRKQIAQPAVLDLNSAIGELKRMMQPVLGGNVELVIAASSVPNHIKIDPVQLQQVLLNLTLNARDAMPDGGRLLIETSTANGDYVVLRVSDTGCGLSDEVKSHIFEPFFTTKPAGAGTGLGLSSVYGIVAQAGGRIEVHSERMRGTSFTISFPRVQAGAPEEARVPVRRESSHCGSETVLITEDRPELLNLLAHTLSRHGYQVLRAGRGEEAMTLAERHAGPIHLLLTDMVMPGLKGTEVADRLRRMRPGIKVLFMSAYMIETLKGYDVAFLAKPFTPEVMLARVREVLDSTAPAARS